MSEDDFSYSTGAFQIPGQSRGLSLYEMYAVLVVCEFIRRMAIESDLTRAMLRDFDVKYEIAATMRLLFGE